MELGRFTGAAATGTEAWRRMRDVDAILASAGVAFFALLSLVPALGALVAVYGLVADPADVAKEVSDLFGPDAGPGRQWVLEQLQRLTAGDASTLGLAAVTAALLALWSGSSGVRHLLDAVDVALGRPRVGLVWARTRGLLGLLVLVVAGAVVVTLLAAAPDSAPAVSWLRYPAIAAVVLAGCLGLYRRDVPAGPARSGALVATGLWVAGSAGLAVYLARGPELEATYGTFASVVAIMLWLWISALALVAGAHVTAVLAGRDRPDQHGEVLSSWRPPGSGPGASSPPG